MASPTLPVLYSTPLAEPVAQFVSAHYDLPGPLECKLLVRGWNDVFEIRANGGARSILRISKPRARGEPDVATETAFLAYLDRRDIPVATAIPTRGGALFTSAPFPEGQRCTVLFRHVGGRASQATQSADDARANGVTLARVHDVADGFPSDDSGRYRLDLDHLVRRPLSAILALECLSESTRADLTDLAARLSADLAQRDGLSWTRCHGDCHGYNANIAVEGPRAGQAVFFDFDESGAGYLAYDLAVFLWNCVIFGRKHHAAWHAFIGGYRAARELRHVDLEAVDLFVPIRHIWLLGEWASRIHEWGEQAVSADWIAGQLDFMLRWEREMLSPRLL
ncbi:kinase [Bradyrhizobium sp. UFLA03-84]|uniref:phosphotransferase enzyme family protein n=1 Tax=Bradyrhizobium sp. UFLA03-84 TaxID=418599 RepID=UPI000BAE0F5B|nr:phosphotransferase [Bradyrhizobium sp. UFLA03-84]PAY04130.1 kinase [Bradyrhizobium sp. UFLA03-84]